MEESEFRAMLDESQRHWWYRGRRRIVCDTLEALRLPPSTRILDAGCGSGAMLDELARYGDTTGVEPHPLGVAAAHRAGHPRVVRARVEELPFAAASFELVTCLAAYPALWSQHDVVNGHHRRYVKRTLVSAATEAGWRPVRHSHFNTFFLLPAAMVRIAFKGQGERQRRSELALTPRSLDPILEIPLRIEAALLRHGIRLPAGLSLLAVFVRPHAAARAARSSAPATPRRAFRIRAG
ncbi:MAG: class I SAM-dependent methyltransferase [Actinobacteria bacterium]|nr:MAG: class I SAM-dependent methyltransferase [Actinomycetota bacterium]